MTNRLRNRQPTLESSSIVAATEAPVDKSVISKNVATAGTKITGNGNSQINTEKGQQAVHSSTTSKKVANAGAKVVQKGVANINKFEIHAITLTIPRSVEGKSLVIVLKAAASNLN